jgi:hypothetical protein
MKLILTEAALDVLRSVRAYTLESWGAEQEERCLRNLWARFETIRPKISLIPCHSDQTDCLF